MSNVETGAGGGGDKSINLDNPQPTTKETVNDSAYLDHNHRKPAAIGVSEKAIRIRTRTLTKAALHYIYDSHNMHAHTHACLVFSRYLSIRGST